MNNKHSYNYRFSILDLTQIELISSHDLKKRIGDCKFSGYQFNNCNNILIYKEHFKDKNLSKVTNFKNQYLLFKISYSKKIIEKDLVEQEKTMGHKRKIKFNLPIFKERPIPKYIAVPCNKKYSKNVSRQLFYHLYELFYYGCNLEVKAEAYNALRFWCIFRSDDFKGEAFNIFKNGPLIGFKYLSGKEILSQSVTDYFIQNDWFRSENDYQIIKLNYSGRWHLSQCSPTASYYNYLSHDLSNVVLTRNHSDKKSGEDYSDFMLSNITRTILRIDEIVNE